MTSVPQTHPRIYPAVESRRRTSSGADASGAAQGRARPVLPAVDPSMAFGCVDWFLYPDQGAGRSAAEVQRA